MKFLYMIVSQQGFSSHSNKFLQHSAAKLLKQRQNMIKASDSVLRKLGPATSFRKAQVPSEVKASKVCPMYNVCPKYVQSMSKVSPIHYIPKRQPPKNHVPRNSQLCWWAAMRDQLRPTTPISWVFADLCSVAPGSNVDPAALWRTGRVGGEASAVKLCLGWWYQWWLDTAG